MLTTMFFGVLRNYYDKTPPACTTHRCQKPACIYFQHIYLSKKPLITAKGESFRKGHSRLLLYNGEKHTKQTETLSRRQTKPQLDKSPKENIFLRKAGSTCKQVVFKRTYLVFYYMIEFEGQL